MNHFVLKGKKLSREFFINLINHEMHCGKTKLNLDKLLKSVFDYINQKFITSDFSN